MQFLMLIRIQLLSSALLKGEAAPGPAQLLAALGACKG